MYFYILLENIFKHNYFFSRKSIYISLCLQDILTVLVYEKDFCKITKAKRIRNCSAKFFVCLAETFGARVHQEKTCNRKSFCRNCVPYRVSEMSIS